MPEPTLVTKNVMLGGAWTWAFAVPTNPQATSATDANNEIRVFAINFLPDTFSCPTFLADMISAHPNGMPALSSIFRLGEEPLKTRGEVSDGLATRMRDRSSAVRLTICRVG